MEQLKRHLNLDTRTIPNFSTTKKKQQKYDIEQSNEHWKTKDLKKNPSVYWEISGRHQPYNVATKQWNLFLNEINVYASR